MGLEDVQAALKGFSNVEVTQEENSIIVKLTQYEPDKKIWGMINQICLGFSGKYEPIPKKPGLWRISIAPQGNPKPGLVCPHCGKGINVLHEVSFDVKDRLEKA